MQSYIKSKLNDEQFTAALHTDTSSLILAGAGSGKTRTLTYKIAYLLHEHKIKNDRILAVTFTNKAANEMKERIVSISQDLIDPEFAGAYIPHFKWIGTFHSTFLKFLKEEIETLDAGYTKDFGIYDTTETMSIIKKIIKDNGRSEAVEAKEAKGFISKLKNEGVTWQLFSKDVENEYDNVMANIYKKYQQTLVTSNSLDFDDLLLLPYHIFHKHPEVLAKRQRSFDYFMVDEAQDTNWIQFELMKMLTGKSGNITFIGDDFQSIYGWRGALMENFLNLKQYRPDIQIFKLQTNYRSRPHIVEAGSHIIKNNQNQYKKDIVAHRDGDDKIVTFSHSDDMSEAINIVDFISKLKKNKEKNRGDFAILYRTNGQSSVFERILVQKGIPYKIFGAFKFFERKEIKDIVSYLKFLLNPKSDIALKRIINTPGRKIGKTSIDRIEEYSQEKEQSIYESMVEIEQLPIKLTSAAKNAIMSFGQLVHKRKTELPDITPAQLIKKVVDNTKYKDYLIKEEGQDVGEEKFENIGQLINMAEKYEGTGEEGLRQFMEEVTLMTDVATQDKEEADAIKLMTVHSSKGLEFPYVFIVGLEENIFPLSNAKMDPKTLEEERRLMYVALTRAEDHIFLSYANSRMQWGQTNQNPPSRFIAELPDHLLKSYDLAGGGRNTYDSGPKIDVGDRVKHKLFGQGEVLEVRNNVSIIKFANQKFGVRRIENRLLELVD